MPDQPGATAVRYPDRAVSPLADAAARSYLTTVGLTREHPLFSARGPDEVTVDDRGGRTLLCLGEVNPHHQRLCVDAGTGEVVSLLLSGGISHLNDSVAQFARSLEAFSARFPFYAENAELEEREEAADELRDTLLEIDPSALREDPGYWYGILHDVAMGDYSDA